MKYSDIKDMVAYTTDSLSVIPGGVVWDMLTDEWARYLPSGGAPDTLPDMTHPRIKCIIHLEYRNRLLYYRLCSVLVDGVPAFFYVSKVEDDYSDKYNKTYVLDMELTKVFLMLIVQLVLEYSTPDSMYLAELVGVREEVHTYTDVEVRLQQGPRLI